MRPVSLRRINSACVGLMAGALAYSQGIITTAVGTTSVQFPQTALPAVNAPLESVTGLAVDKAGNLYIADARANLVLQVSPSGTLTVVAGNGNPSFSGDGGQATIAALNAPQGVAVDGSGNLYIADSGNNRVRKVSGGTISTIAGTGTAGYSGDGSPATAAKLNNPAAVAVDSAGNVFISDTSNGVVRKVSSGGTITTVVRGKPPGNAIEGPCTLFPDPGFAEADGLPATDPNAMLWAPYGIAVDSAGNLYIADGALRVAKVVNGIITTVAGHCLADDTGDGGPANLAGVFPLGVTVDGGGNVYIADYYGNRVRMVSGGTITTIAGSGVSGFSGDGGPAVKGQLSLPFNIAVDAAGNVYVGDRNARVRKISGGNITTVAGNGGASIGDGGPAASAVLNNALPFGLTSSTHIGLDSTNNLYIADSGNNRVRMVASGTITTVAGNGTPGLGGNGGPATSGQLSGPSGVAVDSTGNIYIADLSNTRVQKVSQGTISTAAGYVNKPNPLCGNDDGTSANQITLLSPSDVVVDATGALYIADQFAVIKVQNGIGTTVAGSLCPANFPDNPPLNDNGPATLAGFQPRGIAVDSSGNLYIADGLYHRIRKVSNGKITTVAGSGVQGFSGDGGSANTAQFNTPTGVAVDKNGNIYIADTGNNRVRLVAGGQITTIAGTGVAGFSGDGGSAKSAALLAPTDVALDGLGNIYIADSGNNRIREILASSVTFQSSPSSMSFSATAGGVAPPAQTLSLVGSTPGLPFSINSSAPWLSLSLGNGSMPAGIQVTADPTTLAAGTYSATVTISSPSAVPQTQTLAVTFTVQASTPPKLGVDVSTISFNATQGTSTQTQQLHVKNTGAGSLSYTATVTTTTGASWLSISPASGTATPSSPATMNVTATVGSLNAGTYTGSINITGAGGTSTVTVTLSVSAPNNVILISQTGLNFQAVAQGGTPLPQTFGILNIGQGSMPWSARATTLSGGSAWLNIDQGSGTVPRPYLDVSYVTVSINHAGLAPGDYYGQIQVTSAAANSPQSVTVILNVLPPGTTPGPQIQPTGVIFTGISGANPAPQNVSVGNPKSDPDNYISGIVGSGFTYLPTNQQVQANSPATIHVYPDFSKLSPASVQHGTITLQFADGTPRTISVLSVVAPAGTSSVSVDGFTLQSGCTPNSLSVLQTGLNQNPPSLVTVSHPVSLNVKVVDNCGNPVVYPGGSVTASFSNNDKSISLSSVGSSGFWQGTWTPANATQSQVTIQFTAIEAQGVQAAGGQTSVPVVLSAASTTPVAFGAANAASGVGTYIAPGGLVSIYGAQLADTAASETTVPFPTTVNGTQVLMGGKALPLRYVGNGQVNAQVPFELGINTQQQLIVQHGTTLSVPQNVVVAATQPAVYTQDQSGSGPGVIVDGASIVSPSAPAHIGDTVVIYCNGLGAVNPPVPTGSVAPSQEPLARTVNPVTATIGGVNANVQFSGLVPGYPDLYQVNAVVPAGIALGDQVSVVLTVAGQVSPTVTMAVH